MRAALAACLATLLVADPARAQQPAPDTTVRADAPPPTLAAVAERHLDWCHARYAETERRAEALLRAVDALVARPGSDTLGAARAAWRHAREVYGTTEVLRFHDGPVEPLEPFLNAWPIDEAYLDRVAGSTAGGIVQDTTSFPALGATVLRVANERGGEANVSTGWHAIEFLLWGQDLAADGPGQRPATDFEPGREPHAARRGELLRTITRLLLDDLRTLRAAWAPGADNYRRRRAADPRGTVQRMLTGATVLTAFELAGERLAVALETKDQEQEHSCFSDTTCDDLVANQLGIVAVVCGDGPGASLRALVGGRDAALADLLAARAATALARLRAIPAPFDRAFLGAADAPGPRAIAAAIEALEAQTEVLVLVGAHLGFDLPLRPGG